MQFLSKIDWNLVETRMLVFVLIAVAIGYLFKALSGFASGKSKAGVPVIDVGMVHVIMAAVWHIGSPSTGYMPVLFSLLMGATLASCGVYITRKGKKSRKSVKVPAAQPATADAD
jgi:hypothetical protein